MLAVDYREVMEHVRHRIVGQETAMTQLEQALMLVQADIGDPEKPICILFFAGPTGVGKSETVVALAEALNTDICRVDCNQLTQDHTIASLTGSPPGYVGSAEGNTMLKKDIIEGKPGHPGILVIEEIEKAHPAIWDAFLSVFDKAILTMTNGKGKINFSNTIIVATSNIGSRELKDKVSDNRLGFARHVEKREDLNLDGASRKNIVNQAMEKAFRPEFLGRIDYTVIFRWLTTPELMTILDRFIVQLNDRLAARQLYLELTYQAKEVLVSKGYDIRYGARPLKQAVRKHIEVPLAEEICLRYKAGTKYVLRKTGDTLYFEQAPMVLLEPPKVPDNRTKRVLTIKYDDAIIKHSLDLTLEEAEIFDRWCFAFQNPSVAIYLSGLRTKHIEETVRWMGRIEEKIAESDMRLEELEARIAGIAIAAILRAKNVFSTKVFWMAVETFIGGGD